LKVARFQLFMSPEPSSCVCSCGKCWSLFRGAEVAIIVPSLKVSTDPLSRSKKRHLGYRPLCDWTRGAIPFHVSYTAISVLYSACLAPSHRLALSTRTSFCLFTFSPLHLSDSSPLHLFAFTPPALIPSFALPALSLFISYVPTISQLYSS
jgi:hypothetical protein